MRYPARCTTLVEPERVNLALDVGAQRAVADQQRLHVAAHARALARWRARSSPDPCGRRAAQPARRAARRPRCRARRACRALAGPTARCMSTPSGTTRIRSGSMPLCSRTRATARDTAMIDRRATVLPSRARRCRADESRRAARRPAGRRVGWSPSPRRATACAVCACTTSIRRSRIDAPQPPRGAQVELGRRSAVDDLESRLRGARRKRLACDAPRSPTRGRDAPARRPATAPVARRRASRARCRRAAR